jgi:CRP-like cAMP-binding protein
MSVSNLAQSLASPLSAMGLDQGETFVSAAGDLTTTTRDGEPAVTVILSGVAARTSPNAPLSHGLAIADDMVNFDAVLGDGAVETALWLTSGRFMVVPARRLAQRMDRATLLEAALADMRRRNAALQAEIARHARLRVTQRLGALILDVHDLGGVDIVRLRQSDLADLMAVRRASISTACTELHSIGAIRLRRGAIHIADIDPLRALVGAAIPQ